MLCFDAKQLLAPRLLIPGRVPNEPVKLSPGNGDVDHFFLHGKDLARDRLPSYSTPTGRKIGPRGIGVILYRYYAAKLILPINTAYTFFVHFWSGAFVNQQYGFILASVDGGNYFQFGPRWDGAGWSLTAASNWSFYEIVSVKRRDSAGVEKRDHTIAVTVSATGSMSLYFDGKLDNTGSSAAAVNNNPYNAFYYGATGGSGNGNNAQGDILYSLIKFGRALSAAEILQLHLDPYQMLQAA